MGRVGRDLRFAQGVSAELRRRGRVVNHKRVERLMKLHDMAGFVPRKRCVTTTADSANRRPDLLRGDFRAARPDEASPSP